MMRKTITKRTDIHWFIERRDADGRWHVVMSKTRWYEDRHRPGRAWDEFGEDPESRIGERDHALFLRLSDVQACAGSFAPIARAGVPPDTSSLAAAEIESYGDDGHTHGWISGTEVLARAKGRDKIVSPWFRAIVKLLRSKRCDLVLGRIAWDQENGMRFTDLSGEESAHERADRGVLSDMLLDWTSDPDAFRVLIFYDT